jgi:hypothetical protein
VPVAGFAHAGDQRLTRAALSTGRRAKSNFSNSRAQNRVLFAKILAALVPRGRIAIRDILMEADRTRPVAGALFAINMLVATGGGGTFTFAELRENLEAAGFTEVAMSRQDEAMNAVVLGHKPGS